MNALLLAALAACIPPLEKPLLLDDPTHDYDGDGLTEADGDCDDTRAQVRPGAAERCDDLDNDCDGEIDGDAAIDRPTWYTDADADGFGDATKSVRACERPEGTTTIAGDCDDADPLTNPDTTWYRDADGDGFGDPDRTRSQCRPPNDHVANADDCDDADASAFPDATWYLDNDVDGFGDPDAATTACLAPPLHVANADDCDDDDDDAYPWAKWFRDVDGDGFGDLGARKVQCERPSGYVADDRDCDDNDPERSPLTSWYADEDGDGAGAPGVVIAQCHTPTGLVRNADDCDDDDDELHPGTVWYLDADDDGYGLDDTTLVQCVEPDGYADEGGDCNDDDSDLHPRTRWYADADADGYGDADAFLRQCEPPVGHIADRTDCDDAEPGVNPGEAERCGDEVDEDCDGEAAPCLFEGALSESPLILRGTDPDDGAGWALAWLPDAGLLGVSAPRQPSDAPSVWAVAPAAVPGGLQALTENATFTVQGPAGAVFGEAIAAHGEGAGLWVSSTLGGGDGTLPVVAYFASNLSGPSTLTHASAQIVAENSNQLDEAILLASADLDGTGAPSLVVASPNTTALFVFLGVPFADSSLSAASYQWVVPGLSADSAIERVPDALGDGRDRLVVGLPNTDTALLLGELSADSLDTLAHLRITGPPGSAVGTAIAAADFDGDGATDLVVGAPGDHALWVVWGPLAERGDTLALPDGADLIIQRPGAGSFGGQLRATADLDGDGLPDLIAQGATPSRLYAFSGGALRTTLDGTAPADAAMRTWTIGETAPYTYHIASGDGSGDRFGDLFVGRTSANEGQVHLLPGGLAD